MIFRKDFSIVDNYENPKQIFLYVIDTPNSLKTLSNMVLFPLGVIRYPMCHYNYVYIETRTNRIVPVLLGFTYVFK